MQVRRTQTNDLHPKVEAHCASLVHGTLSQRLVVGLQARPVWQGLVALQPGTQACSSAHAQGRGSQISGAHSASFAQVLGVLLQMPQLGGASGETQKVLPRQSALLEQHAGSGHGPSGQNGGCEAVV